MARVNQIYNTQALYVGPSPSSGYHFMSGDGTLNNAYNELVYNRNLLQPLNRVQSASYSFNLDYGELKQLGKRGTVYSPLINNPSVVLSFNYLQNSVLNELRLGFNANYFNEIDSGTYYSNNFGQSLISGLISRELNQPTSAPYWPLSYRDRKNLFIVSGPRGNDINTTDETEYHPKSQTYVVYNFGDGYLTNYNTRGSVGSFPSTSISFICENLEIVSSGSGVNIPSLNPRTKAYANENKFVIPPTYDGPNQVTVFLPGDINLSFESINHKTGILALYGTGYDNGAANTNITNLGYAFSDLKAQNYDISMTLNRQPLYSLGYELPVDRPIVFPVFATLNTSFIVGDEQTGRLMDLMTINSDYNVRITINNPSTHVRRGVGTQYDFRRAKLTNWNVDSTIGPSKVANMGFVTELDPDDLSRGFFVSGRINIDSAEDYLLKQDDDMMFLLSDTSSDVILKYKFNVPAF